MEKFDAIIIGAGPAGASCALQLIPAGGRILLLDKYAFPRNKACGGGFSQKTRDLFDFDLSSVIETWITSAEIFLRSSQPAVVDCPQGAGFMVTRQKFDACLVSRAVDKGVALHEEEALTGVSPERHGWLVTTDKDTYFTDFLVGADGAVSRTARCLGLMTAFDRFAPALTAEIIPTARHLERLAHHVIFDFHIVPKGYAWIFPKSDHLSVGVFSTKMPHKGLNTALNRFIDSRVFLRNRPVRYWKGGLIPRGGTRQQLVKNRALLAGDAAAMTDPFFGEGLYYAARSGQLAARAILQSAQKGTPDLKHYESACRQAITNDLWWARLFNFGFYRFPFLFYPAIRNSAQLQRVIIDLNSGRFTWKKAVFRVLQLLPQWLTRMVVP